MEWIKGIALTAGVGLFIHWLWPALVAQGLKSALPWIYRQVVRFADYVAAHSTPEQYEKFTDTMQAANNKMFIQAQLALDKHDKNPAEWVDSLVAELRRLNLLKGQ